MYVPGPFAVEDSAEAVAMLRAAAFGHLMVADGDGFEGSPLPFLVDDDMTSVRMHVARPNPIWRLAPRSACLVVTVSDAYISPSWYPSKQEHGKVVPTWNYEVVYVHGRLVAQDTEWTMQLVRDLTDFHETDRLEPWAVDDAPADYIQKLSAGIVGLSLEVTRFETKRKLSQNKSAADVAGTVAGLAASPAERDRVVGEAMAHTDQKEQ